MTFDAASAPPPRRPGGARPAPGTPRRRTDASGRQAGWVLTAGTRRPGDAGYAALARGRVPAGPLEQEMARPVEVVASAAMVTGARGTGSASCPPTPAYLRDVPPPSAPMDDPLVDPAFGDTEVPFGLPVLDEVPMLAAVLLDLRAVDRRMAQVLHTLLLLEETGMAEAVTGLGLNHWLTLVGRRTGADARMLRTAAAALRRVPTLRGAFDAGQVSWAQVRSVALEVHRLPERLDDRIDAAVADALNGMGGAEPDALTRVIRWHLAALVPDATAQEEQQGHVQEYLAMQPRLDGTGGRIWGELGAVAFATLDAALNLPTSPTSAPDRSDGDDPDDGSGADARRHMRTAGRRRLQRLVDHLDAVLAGRHRSPGSRSGTEATAPNGHAGSRPQLLLRTHLSTLLDRDETPAELLTTLLGGHARVTASTARRLVDERGADLRTVILDDTGAVVGVGRRRRLAPGWLADATLALHSVCATPGCEIAARRCETDHATPWHPVRPIDPAGRTDIDQLAPTCKHDNRLKESTGWAVTQRPDGTRRWHHPRSGITTTTYPAIWNPAPTPHPPPDTG